MCVVFVLFMYVFYCRGFKVIFVYVFIDCVEVVNVLKCGVSC